MKGTAEIKKEEFSKEVSHIQRIVGKYFPIYDVKIAYNTIGFFCRVIEETVEENFDLLRRELIPQNYIPLLTVEKGDYVIYVTKKPPAKYRSVTVNAVLLGVTILTTVLAGSVAYIEYEQRLIPENPLAFVRTSFLPHYLFYGGLCFALPLMTILGVHELGHYYMCKRHSVSASLPFFIPVPPYFSPLGTFGAFISVREPIPSKKALIDIGFAGPIAGFVVAIPVTMIGLYLTSLYAQPVPEDMSNAFIMGSSIFYTGLVYLIPAPPEVLLHPTAFAGWVGLLVTALNLLPAGQLDGGHIARALLGEKARYASYCAIAFLFVLGMFFAAWLIFALIIIFLGVRHPPPLNDVTKLDIKRKFIGGCAAVILITCFVAEPWRPVELEYDFDFDLMADENQTKYVPINSTLTYNFTIKNEGNTKNELKLKVDIIEDIKSHHVPPPHIEGVRLHNNTTANVTKIDDDEWKFKLPVNESVNFTLVLFIYNVSDLIGKNFTIKVTVETTKIKLELQEPREKPKTIECKVYIIDKRSNHLK